MGPDTAIARHEDASGETFRLWWHCGTWCWFRFVLRGLGWRYEREATPAEVQGRTWEVPA